MQKETTVLLICLLILFADILGAWQTINLRLNEQIFSDQISVIVILTSLGIFALLLLWINYVLVRKIIGKQLS